MCFAKRVSKPVVRTGAHPLHYLMQKFWCIISAGPRTGSPATRASPLVPLYLTLFRPVLFCLALFGDRALAELDGPLRLG